MTKNNELFTTMPVGKAVAKLAVPTVVSQIIVILYSLADTFFIGQIGDPNQIAALSITFPIYTLLTAVANLFGIGANSVIARSMGQNDEATAKRASSFSFWASILVTAVLSVGLAIFMRPIRCFSVQMNLPWALQRTIYSGCLWSAAFPRLQGLFWAIWCARLAKQKRPELALPSVVS